MADRSPRRDRPLPALAQKYGIDPFTLFCAYYLGVTAEGTYRFQNIHEVAKRFGVGAGVIKQLLQELRMDSDSIVHSTFDLASAQVDVIHVPEGIDRVEIARTHYELFLDAPRGKRDWNRELADDARMNEKTFGPSRGVPASSSRRRS